jgi:hypothetical protein
VQFAHGLESSPQGNKARLLDQHFTALTPSMNTRDIEGCIDVHARALREFRPHVLVGSSFGGAVALALLTRGLFTGPTLLLAQAGLRYFPGAGLPPAVAVTLVHARADDVVDFADSLQLAQTGSADRVQLLARDDDHALTTLCASGELVTLVSALHDAYAR